MIETSARKVHEGKMRCLGKFRPSRGAHDLDGTEVLGAKGSDYEASRPSPGMHDLDGTTATC